MHKSAKVALLLTVIILASAPTVAADWTISSQWQTGTWHIQQFPEPSNPPNTGGTSGGSDIVVTQPTQEPTDTDPDATTNPNPTNQTKGANPLNPENLPYAFYFIAAVCFGLAVAVVAASTQNKNRNKNKVTWKPY